ncbi:hypothetical protein [Candidatus Competibacter denitrificans]|uniref:hypothetical protein n=1 Tax=Candidatus Competibacter denitrificans TaxID=1400862 RepID=UPI001112995B|nr:hypothetical protein [Candidatus Competibacter denitrificans]
MLKKNKIKNIQTIIKASRRVSASANFSLSQRAECFRLCTTSQQLRKIYGTPPNMRPQTPIPEIHTEDEDSSSNIRYDNEIKPNTIGGIRRDFW